MGSLGKLTLHADQLALLSNFTTPFSHTVDEFLRLTALNGYTETSFQLSLLLEAWLNKLEEQKGEAETYAAILLNSEYLLISRNRDVELKYNPFFKHWVDVVLRIRPLVFKVISHDEEVVPQWWALAHGARLLLIEAALGLSEWADLAFASPADLLERIDEVIGRQDLEMGYFIDVLEEQGLWRSVIPFESPASETTHLSMSESLVDSSLESIKSKSPPPSKPFSQQQSQDEALLRAIKAMDDDNVPRIQDFYVYLHSAPEEAYDYLSHLKPTNSEQSFLASILTSSAGCEILELYGFSPATLAMQQLQYALRHVENVAHVSEEGVSRIGGSWEELERTLQLLRVYLDKVLDEGVLDIESVLWDLHSVGKQYIFLEWVRQVWTPWLEERMVRSEFGADGQVSELTTGIGGDIPTGAGG